jgi:ribosomal protein S18 acetylase RimI-like enzyme
MMRLTTEPLEHRGLSTATKIHALQMAAYTQEAELLEVKHFPPLERSLEDVLDSDEVFLGVLLDETLVGCIAYEILPEGWLISSLVVSPQHQRLGIARALVNAVLDLGQGKSITVATGAKNTPALGLYHSVGFAEYNRFFMAKDGLEIVQLRLEVQ